MTESPAGHDSEEVTVASGDAARSAAVAAVSPTAVSPTLAEHSSTPRPRPGRIDHAAPTRPATPVFREGELLEDGPVSADGPTIRASAAPPLGGDTLRRVPEDDTLTGVAGTTARPGDAGHTLTLGQDETEGSAGRLVRTRKTPGKTPGEREPRVLGGFELRSVLGRGGMGIVYKAYQPALDRTVAIKVMTSGVDASKIEVARFLREASAAARLQHPAIVPIHAVGEDEGCLFFAMDYIEGKPLGETAKEEGFGPRRALELVQEVAQALHYAHTQGVIHRDVKPGNILVDKSGGPHLTDFGLAKDLKKGALTVSNAVLGTPAYMPPEQARGDAAAVDARSDVYALGAVLYHLICGRPPFVGDSLLEILAKVCDQEPPAPKSLVRTVHRDIETICLRCLQKAPSRRYQTAKDLSRDIGRYLAGETILARPAGPVERVWRRARRHRAVVGIAAAAVVALALVVGFFVRRARQAERARQANVAREVQAGEAALARATREIREASERVQVLERAIRRFEAALVLDDQSERARVALAAARGQRSVLLQELERARAARQAAEDRRVREAARVKAEAEARAARLREVQARVDALMRYARSTLQAGDAAAKAARSPFETLAQYKDALSAFQAADAALAELGDLEARLPVPERRSAPLSKASQQGRRKALRARFEVGLQNRQFSIAREAAQDLQRTGAPAKELLARLEAARVSEEQLSRDLDNAWRLFQAGQYRRAREAARALAPRASGDLQAQARRLVQAATQSEVTALLRDAAATEDLAARRRLLGEALALRPGQREAVSALRETEARLACPAGFVYVPGGTYEVGSDDPEDHNPRRTVAIEPFYLSAREVSAEAFAAFCAAGGYAQLGPAARACREKATGKPGPLGFQGGRPVAGGERLPVTGVSFVEAKAYAGWVSIGGERGFRLPRSDEWEVAAAFDPTARAMRTYPWGDAPPAAERGAFKFDPARRPEDMRPDPVGLPKNRGDRSALGAWDLGGNAQEWTVGGGGAALLKGGASNLASRRYARCAWRPPNPLPPAYRTRSTGFRLARSLSAAPRSKEGSR